ncbi:hypothetical protein [Neorhizobium tomejilense]|uniref:hypothetical protein n=1 Tax=Neorhizobium tomejilense TaxID=2093828 RepID=UPI003ED0D19E
MSVRKGRRYSVVTQEYEDFEEPDFEVTEIVVVAPDISDRQFFQQLAVEGYISESEALAAVSVGALPAAVEAIVGALTPEDQFSARMLLSGATRFERAHPLVEVFAAAIGMTTQQLDAFWAAASELY